MVSGLVHAVPTSPVKRNLREKALLSFIIDLSVLWIEDYDKPASRQY
jgi:hypothetical protein